MSSAVTTPSLCILFDLDGTLLDTAPDMARALNRLRQEEGYPALPFEAIRPMVSHGSPGLIKLGFGRAPDDVEFEILRQRFLHLYASDLAVKTALFPGMENVLQQLEANAIPWGVVTNKPAWLTEPLLRALRLWEWAACVVSGDTLAQRKPDPAPLLYASRQVGVAPECCIYVGDAERDVQAGKSAGMKTLVACFGYLGEADRPEIWQADGLIDKPEELFAWLDFPG